MSGKRVVVNLYYDIMSPYSWIGFELLCRYRPQWQSMSLKFKPIFLAAVLQQTDNPTVLRVPNKLRHINEDLKRLNAYYRVPVVIPDFFADYAANKTSLRTQRFVTAIDILTNGKSTEDISRQLWKRFFVSHQDIVLADSLREAANKCDISQEIIEKAIVLMEKTECKDALRKTTDELVAYGGFGSPSVVIDLPKGPELVFGCDRMHIIGQLIGEKYVGPLYKYSAL